MAQMTLLPIAEAQAAVDRYREWDGFQKGYLMSISDAELIIGKRHAVGTRRTLGEDSAEVEPCAL